MGGAGGWATKTNRKLQDGDNDEDCVAEMPPLERKKTAAPLRIELRDLHLAGEGVGGRVLVVWRGWVWSVNDKQTSDVLRRLRLRLRPGADKKNCQSALKVCNASKVSCKIDKYNADRQLLQLLLLLLPLLHCYCNNNIDSAFASRQSAGEGIKMGKKSSAECRLVIAANAAEAADRCRNSLIKFY